MFETLDGLFPALGLDYNPTFSDDHAACMVRITPMMLVT